MINNPIIIFHLINCSFMTGLIWLVQVDVYPMFKLFGKQEFYSLHQLHRRKITLIVLPALILESGTALWLYFLQPNNFMLLNLIGIIILLALTFFLNIPNYNQLNFDSFESKLKLVKYNWPRTILWSLRTILLYYYYITL
jgi:hypothetical protein